MQPSPTAHIVPRIPLGYVSWEDLAAYWLRGLRGRRVLDFGCGIGTVLSKLDASNHRVGLDVSRENLARARARCDRRVVLVRVGPEVRLPFADATFDAAVASEVLEHVPDEREMLDELARVLRDDAILILTTPHQHWLSALDLGNLKFRFPRLHRLVLTRLRGVSRADFDRRYGGAGGLIGDVSVQAAPWHRHYSLKQVTSLVTPRFAIERVFIFGPIARLAWPIGRLLGRIHPRLEKLVQRIDHASRRRFSWHGFDLALSARRRARAGAHPGALRFNPDHEAARDALNAALHRR